MNLVIRPETPADSPSVAEVNTLAFGRPNEARLVERVRASEHYLPGLSLVAEAEGRVVGHILFSYVGLEGPTPCRVLALAPMAVHPDWQGQGVGSALVEAGLEKCISLHESSEAAGRMGEPLVVVLGHRNFYPRFGFEPSVRYRIEPPFPVDEAVFMVRPLPGYSPGLRGRIVYPPAFAEV